MAKDNIEQKQNLIDLMNMEKQTAVEWLYKMLERMIPRTELYNMDKKIYFEQAKEMEKQQIIEAYEIAYMDGYNDNRKDGK
jgi:hypothetical protein